MKKIISFCFDDGFRRSTETICQVFEARRLKACFAILADPEHALDPYLQGEDLGDWKFWRSVMDAGHEVASHGLMHERYDELSFEAVTASILEALEQMETHLPSFHRETNVFHVPYLSAPDSIVQWLRTQSLGVRLGTSSGGINRLSDIKLGCPIDCICFGPDNVYESLTACIQNFKEQEEGWLVLVLHGVDGEGWGALSRSDLEHLIDNALACDFRFATPNEMLADRKIKC